MSKQSAAGSRAPGPLSSVAGRAVAAAAVLCLGGLAMAAAVVDAAGQRHIAASRALLSAGQTAAAREAAERGLRWQPGEPVGLWLRGCALALEGDRAGAEEALRLSAARSFRPSDPLRLYASLVAGQPGREAEGLRLLERAAALEPEPAREAGTLWLNLGRTALREGQPAKAAWAFRRAEDLNERSAALAGGLAQACEALGLPDAAWAARIDPRHQ